MANKRKWTQEEYEYQQKYIRNNIKFISVPFNMRNQDDLKLYEYLQNVEGKKAAYIKQLIMDDIARIGCQNGCQIEKATAGTPEE